MTHATSQSKPTTGLVGLQEAALAGKRHQGGLRMMPCLALDPDWFSRIRESVHALIAGERGSDVTNPAHPTYWVRPYGQAVQFSLLNRSGRTDDAAGDFDGDPEGRSFRLNQYPEIGRLIESFGGRPINFRLSCLQPRSGLSPHEEFIAGARGVCLRFHLPVLTNPQATLILDEEEFHFREGVIYFFNKGCVHAADNRGVTPRSHFLFDMWLDEWVYEHIFDASSPLTPDPAMRKIPEADRAELSRSRPRPVADYVVGNPDGLLELKQRTHSEEGVTTVTRRAYRFAWDIVDLDGPISIGPGWYTQETWEGQFFRWCPNEAFLDIEAASDGMRTAVVDLEPGPGCAGQPLDLAVTDDHDCYLGEFTVAGRQMIRFPVPVHRGSNRVRLLARNGGQTVSGDTRILNFRAMSIALE
jgi:hypothetical protein